MQLLVVIGFFPTRMLGVLCVTLGVACVAIAVGILFAKPLGRFVSELEARFLALSPLNKAVLVLALAVSTVCAQKGTNRPPAMIVRPTPQNEVAQVWQLVGENVVRAEILYRCGATEDALRLKFGEGFLFPDGSNHLDRVVILSSGEVRRTLQDRDALVRFDERLWSRPYDSELTAEHTPSNSYRFVWSRFYANGDTNLSRTVSAELFRNGNIAVTENGSTTIAPYVIPFPHDGFGQDDEWVRANFTNAAEVLSVGYADWIDDQVGVNLENGLYKFTATFPDAPPEATRLFVGDKTVCVTNAGEYVFLLEKGVEYEFGTVPYDDSVEYTMQDDVAPFAPAFAAWWWDGDVRGEWTVDGGWYELEHPLLGIPGSCFWMPLFCGRPDIDHVLQDDLPLTVTAQFVDCRRTDVVDDASFHWSATGWDLDFEDPNAQTTRITVDDFPNWTDVAIEVSATVCGRELASRIWMTLGSHRTPQVSAAIRGASHVWVNRPESTGNRRTYSVLIQSDVPTNGVFTVEYCGSAAHANVTPVGPWQIDVYEIMTMPYEQEIAVVEGMAPSEFCGQEYFAWRFETPDGNVLAGTNVFTVVAVDHVDLWSDKGGPVDENMKLPFPGQEQALFRLNQSPDPDRHYPVFFHNVADTNFCVQPYSVEYRVETRPSDFVVTGGRTSLELLDGPVSGMLRGAVGKTAYYDTPSEGGVYKVAVCYADSPPTETILVLPIAGASVDSVVALDLERANATVEFITNHYSVARRQDPTFGLTWFNDDGMGDYRGRVDCADKPTAWCYNQVNDESGLGAVATFYGLPVRMAKMSNFLVGYATTRIGVSASRRWFAQAIGRFNDATATMSWDAGVSFASGAPYEETVVTLSTAMWPLSDEKERRLWPNLAVQTNHTSWRRIVNFNYSFVSPGFAERTPK